MSKQTNDDILAQDKERTDVLLSALKKDPLDAYDVMELYPDLLKDELDKVKKTSKKELNEASNILQKVENLISEKVYYQDEMKDELDKFRMELQKVANVLNKADELLSQNPTDELNDMVSQKIADALNEQTHFQGKKNLLMAFELLQRANFDIKSSIQDHDNPNDPSSDKRNAFIHGLVERLHDIDLSEFGLGWNEKNFQYKKRGKELAEELSNMASLEDFMPLVRARISHVADMAFGRENLFPHGQSALNEVGEVKNPNDMVLVMKNGEWGHAPFASHTGGFIEDPYFDSIGVDAFDTLYEKPPYADRALMMTPEFEGEVEAIVKIYKNHPDDKNMSLAISLNPDETYYVNNCFNLETLSLEPFFERELGYVIKQMKNNGAFDDPVFKVFKENNGVIPAPELEKNPQWVLETKVSQLVDEVLENYYKGDYEEDPHVESPFEKSCIDFGKLPKEGKEYIKHYMPNTHSQLDISIYRHLEGKSIPSPNGIKEFPLIMDTLFTSKNMVEFALDADNLELLVFTNKKSQFFPIEEDIEKTVAEAFDYFVEQTDLREEEIEHVIGKDPERFISNMASFAEEYLNNFYKDIDNDDDFDKEEHASATMYAPSI